jgi:hypothetical protein
MSNLFSSDNLICRFRILANINRPDATAPLWHEANGEPQIRWSLFTRWFAAREGLSPTPIFSDTKRATEPGQLKQPLDYCSPHADLRLPLTPILAATIWAKR